MAISFKDKVAIITGRSVGASRSDHKKIAEGN
jgi:hypothetical protein